MVENCEKNTFVLLTCPPLLASHHFSSIVQASCFPCISHLSSHCFFNISGGVLLRGQLVVRAASAMATFVMAAADWMPGRLFSTAADVLLLV